MLASSCVWLTRIDEGPVPGAGRGLGGRADVRMLAVSPGFGRLFGGDFGDGGAGGGLVDDSLVRREGRDEGLQGEVVHRPG
jgi:hypothetical protein